MNTREKIIKAFSDFGIELSEDLRESLNRELKKHGRRSPQEARLVFSPKIKTLESGNVSLNIVADDVYWKFIEKGRKPRAKRVPADALGKKWQNLNGINAVAILSKMKSKKPGTKMNYDKAAKSLAFIIQRSIYKKGIKPKPFVDKVINDGRFEAFKKELRPLLSENMMISIKGL